MTTISIHQRGAGKLKKEQHRLTSVQLPAVIIAIAKACVSEHAGNGPMPALLFAGGHDV